MSSVVGKYRLGPFLLASEIALPELRQHDSGTADVVIRIGVVPERIDGVVANETRWWASREEYLQRVPGVASFLVRHGREVIVEPAEGALPGDIRAYLLSPIFSTLCHQAGMYSLHASSVRVGDGVVAFLGNSGAGKSTLAAYLARRGYAVVSDDICLLDPRPRAEDGEVTGGEGAGSILVVPVAPALKLWRSALEQLGGSPAELARVFSRDDKYRIPISEPEVQLPLVEVVFLEWAEAADAAPALTPVRGVEAVTRLMEFTHYDYLMKATGRQTGHFLLSSRILDTARAFSFRRARNFAGINEGLDALERHLSELQTGARRVEA